MFAVLFSFLISLVIGAMMVGAYNAWGIAGAAILVIVLITSILSIASSMILRVK